MSGHGGAATGIATDVIVSAGNRPADEKLLGLEAVRFVSAFAVLIWHYQHFYYVGDKPGANYIVQNQPLYSLFALLYRSGYFGVNVFWCISGFIFFWKYRDSIADRLIDTRNFFLLRFSRLYPLHFSTLLLVALLQTVFYHQKGEFFVYLFNDAYHFVLQLFMASNWGLQVSYSFNGPIWSISIEVLIYILFFVTLRYLGTTLLVAAAAIAVSVAAKLLKYESPIFDCLGFFYAGGLACVVRAAVRGTPLGRWIRTVGWGALVGYPGMAILLGAFDMPRFGFLFTWFFWLSFTPLLLFLTAGDIAVGARSRRLIEAAGNMTYSSYLIHFPLQLAIAIGFAWAGRSMPAGSPLLLLSYLAITLILSYAVYELFERPAQRLIRRRFGTRQVVAPPRD